MLELGLPRALVISALTLSTTFAAGAAHAEPPAPPPPPAAPIDLGYAAPPGAALRFEQQPEYPPEMHARSTGMVAGGVVLLSFGVVGLFAGSAMIGAHEPTVDQPNTCLDCGFEDGGGSRDTGSSSVVLKPGFQTAGIVTLIGSAVAVAAAIPLIVIGARKVPYTDAASPATTAAKLTPTLRIGAANATVLWQF